MEQGQPVLYQDIVELQTEMICRYGTDGTIEYVNPAYCRYFGVDAATRLGHSHKSVIYPPDLPGALAQLQSMSCKDSQVIIEHRVVVDGDVRWTRWHHRGLCHGAGEISGFQAVGRDISALKTIEAMLGGSETDPDAPEQTLEQRIENRVARVMAANHDLRQKVQERQPIEAVLQNREERFCRATETERALAMRLRQQSVITQLTHRALSGLKLQSLFNQATRLVATSLGIEFTKVLKLLPDGQSLHLQAGFGWQPGQVGQAAVSAEHNSQAGYTLLAQQPVVVENLATETRFHGPPLLTEHGVVSGISTIIQGVEGQPFGVLGAHSTQVQHFSQNDIDFLQAVANLLATAIYRKHTEHQLQQLNQHLEQRVQERTQALEEVNHELEAFSYSVAHDLRAPLRAIQGFAQVIVEDYKDVLDTPGKDYIYRVAASAEHLDALVQDLLTYSRLGRTAIHPQPVNLNRLIDNVLSDLKPAITSTGAQVEVASHLPVVQGQRGVLRQVVTNLIDNAIKFVVPGERPQVRLWAEVKFLSPGSHGGQGATVRLWVEDQGIGVAPEHQSRIFAAFERLHGVESYSGTGIGLAIVRRGIQRIGGEVGVEAELGQGSRFWLDLPLAS
jgi:PAS domain S-box-containing protein